MADRIDLDAAVAAGVIDRDTAERLRLFARQPAPSPFATRTVPTASEGAGPEARGEERFRFIGGFNDILVAIGLALLIGALFGFAQSLGLQNAMLLVALGTAWGLAEVFTRHLRLALPTIILATMFAVSGALVVGMVVFAMLEQAGWRETRASGVTLIFAGATAAGLAALHHRRFAAPVDVGLMAGGGCVAFLGLGLVGLGDAWWDLLPFLSLVAGAVVFAAAMREDLADRERVTLAADRGFWLHLLAAPLLVHAVLGGLGGGRDIMAQTPTGAAITLVLFALFAVVALVIDRRALLISGLLYAGVALAYLISRTGEGGSSLTVTLLALAILVLTVSAGWRWLRARLLAVLPLGGLAARLPPP